MQLWANKFEAVEAIDGPEIDRVLTEYGAAGWELVSSTSMQAPNGDWIIYLFFKRPI